LSIRFSKQQGGKDFGYFEDAVARQLTIASIPTVLIVDPAGKSLEPPGPSFLNGSRNS
jgi:hypothetical protein